MEKAKPILAKEGIDLKIEKYQDYVLPNQHLESGELDANYFQHLPYLELSMKENGYDFVNAGAIHIEPIGIYSKNINLLRIFQREQQFYFLAQYQTTVVCCHC